jgi:hypothetical protein
VKILDWAGCVVGMGGTCQIMGGCYGERRPIVKSRARWNMFQGSHRFAPGTELEEVSKELRSIEEGDRVGRTPW